MLPSTQQIFQLLHLDLHLLRQVSGIHEHHQAGIRVVIEVPIRILIGAARRIKY
jgi:hypothetical protein